MRRHGNRLFRNTTTSGRRSSQKKKLSDTLNINLGISRLTWSKMPQKYWIAKYIRLLSRNREDSRIISEKTWRKDISDLRTPSTRHPFSLLGKRTGSFDQWSTI